MSKRVQRLGHSGTTALTFVGLERELTIDTTRRSVRLHDGATQGGVELARADLNNVPDATTTTPGRFSSANLIALNQAISDIADNVTAIGVNAADIATNVADIAALDAAKPDKVVPAVAGNVATLTAGGALADGGKTVAQLNDCVAGTVALFLQAAAPAGWTLSAAHNDRVLRINNTVGGGVGGSWTISGFASAGHVLTTAELPASGLTVTGTAASAGAHTHSTPRANAVNSGTTTLRRGDDATVSGATNTSSDGAHTHSVSGTTSNMGSGNAHAHGLTYTPGWRPLYVDAIACTRNA